MCDCSLTLEALALEPPRVCAEVAAPAQVPQVQALPHCQEKRAMWECRLSLDALALGPPRVCAALTGGDHDEHSVSAIKRLMDLRSQRCVESEAVASEELSTNSSSSTKSVTFSDSCDLMSSEDLSASEGEDDNVPVLVCQATASTTSPCTRSTKSVTFSDYKAAAQQELVWETACSAARTAIMHSQIDQWQMACQDMSEWHAAQMMQWQHVASANQAGQEPKKAQWKVGDAFEVESAFVTCDRGKMRVEPLARGTVMRIDQGCKARDTVDVKGHRRIPKMSVKFDNSKQCKWICPEDYHKLRRVAH